jgi:hypothetical protein
VRKKPITATERVVVCGFESVTGPHVLIFSGNGWSPRDLYRTLETPDANPLRAAHAARDTAVRRECSMTDNENNLTFLLK